MLSGAFMVAGLACNAADPVATQYKKQNPDGAAVAAPPAGNNGNNGNNNPGNNADASQAEGDAVAGRAFFTGAGSCVGCHAPGGPNSELGAGYGYEDLLEAKPKASVHANFFPAAAQEEKILRDVAAYLDTL